MENERKNFERACGFSADEIDAYFRAVESGEFDSHLDLFWANLAVFCLQNALHDEEARADEAEKRAEKAKAKAKKAKAKAKKAKAMVKKERARADDLEVELDDVEDILDMIRMAVDNDPSRRR